MTDAELPTVNVRTFRQMGDAGIFLVVFTFDRAPRLAEGTMNYVHRIASRSGAFGNVYVLQPPPGQNDWLLAFRAHSPRTMEAINTLVELTADAHNFQVVWETTVAVPEGVNTMKYYISLQDEPPTSPQPE